MRKVDFFIVGAPKCGTTSLAQYLAEHENVCFSVPKEPLFFCTDFRNLITYNNEKEYLQCFQVNQNHKLLGESSVVYLNSKKAVQNILQYNPKAKFITMLRNPIDLIYSWHSQKCFEYQENEKDFKKAWQLQAVRKEGISIPPLCTEPKLLQYKEWGLLGKQVRRVFEVVGEKNCHIVFFGDFVQDTRKIYKDVLHFLELPDDGRINFQQHNPNKECKNHSLDELRVKISRFRRNNHFINKLHKKVADFISPQGIGFQKAFIALNYKKMQRIPLDFEFRKELLIEFSEDIRLLEHLTGRDLSHWK